MASKSTVHETWVLSSSSLRRARTDELRSPSSSPAFVKLSSLTRPTVSFSLVTRWEEESRRESRIHSSAGERGHANLDSLSRLLSILWSCPVDFFRSKFDAHPTSYSHPPISTPFVTNFSSGLPPGRPIHCYVYGPPCVASSDLARHTRGLITSVVRESPLPSFLVKSLGFF